MFSCENEGTNGSNFTIMKSAIQSLFPNFPDDIIDQWLLPYATKRGWPPQEVNGVLHGDWRYLLGTSTNLAYWKNIKWRFESVDLQINDLDNSSKDSVLQIISTAIFDIDTVMSRSICDLKERFNRIVSYFSEHGVFPVAPVLSRYNGQYKLMDGNHRVAAYFYCSGYITKSPAREIVLKTRLKQSYWIGSEPNKRLQAIGAKARLQPEP